MDFKATRLENDERLLPDLEKIKSATNMQTLFPFAKAYLGMFYLIDRDMPAKEKINLLANPELADAVLQGFVASLDHSDIPNVADIGHAAAKKKEFPQGYVVLAGLDLLAQEDMDAVVNLDSNLLESAIAFYYSNKNNLKHIWFDYLLEQHKNIVISALTKYWIALLKNGATFLPGKNFIFSDNADAEFIQYAILPLLRYWKRCKDKTLFQLLTLAVQYSNGNEVAELCQEILKDDKRLNEKTRLYWLTTAYLLEPDKYYANLTTYVGRVKMKTLPLLDFTVNLITKNESLKNKLSIKAIIQLLRLIAPVFPPQQHTYGALGGLDINSRNVMTMFYYLLCSDEKNAMSEIKALKKARVMKIYSDVIDNLLELHLRKQNETGFKLPDFSEYIESLVKNNKLEGRSNKFDIR